MKRLFPFFAAALLFASHASCQTPIVIRAEVDATSLSRHLLKSEMTFSVEQGEFAVWFPKWIPGIHGPGRQIGNVAGLRVATPDGRPLAWQRDPSELSRFLIDVPDKVHTILVELTYIANQPTTNSRGVDSFGNADVAVVNFNTCLLYPDGASAEETQIALSVRLPAGWKYGTALKATGEQSDEQLVQFETASLRTVIDSPLIAGRCYRKLEIDTPGYPSTTMHFVSESPAALEFDEDQADHYRQLMDEAYLLFGGAPYSQYHFLVGCSDSIPPMGLEHHESSLNVIGEQALVDEDLQKGWSAYLLPHELVHAWCGKFRRPEGMVRPAYHSTKQTELLWIYEGLTQYLGGVLTARSELLSFDKHVERTAGKIGYLRLRQGRSWRSLADTAIANYTLRASSQSWNDLRRGQDYYDEGALFWLEVDCLIREHTSGEKSLDDFCRKFFAHAPGDAKIKPFELEEVIAHLSALAEFDWQGLIRRRVYQPMDDLELEGLWRAGYSFGFTEDKPEYVRLREEDREYTSAEHSLGVTLAEGGKVLTVAPESAADRAGIAATMKVVGVNGFKYTEKRFTQAIANSPDAGRVELLLLEDDKFRTIAVPYEGGARYPAIERIEDRPDLMREICAPLGRRLETARN